MSAEIALARAYLSRVAEPATVAVWAWVRAVGPVEAAATIRTGRVPADVARETEARRAACDPHADLETAERHGIRLVTPEDGDWPHFALAALERTGVARASRYAAGERGPTPSGEPIPPLALWACGPAELATLAVRGLGVVGSRAATAYGELVTADLAYGVAARGVTVVSGGAYGIDAAAHRAALAAGGQTVLVSAGGLDRPYPPGNAALYERVSASGAVLSESPPGATPQRHRFLSRNRLIAALSTATLVVEAAHRSGAANTAAHAVAQGRPLLAVPGPVTSPMSAGCHELIRRERDPAVLVTCVDDLLAVVGAVGEGIGITGAGSSGERPEASSPDELGALDPTARRVLDGLPGRGWAPPDAIAVRSGVPVREVLQALPMLELAGLVQARADGYRVSPRVRAGAASGQRGGLHRRAGARTVTE
jgi:DNA processing protein